MRHRLAFRGTLSAVVTGIDHLYGLHLSVANAIITANVEVAPPGTHTHRSRLPPPTHLMRSRAQELDPDHPLRRLMTPFGYRTAAINWRASFALVNEFGLLHRAMPFTKQGLRQLFDFARTSSAGITWATITARHAAKGVDSVTLPLDEDGDEYYLLLRRFVSDYLVKYYPSGECAADAGVQAWHRRVNRIAPNHDVPSVDSCDALADILATFMYLVSAGHRHVGTIAAELEDPCWAPWSWRDGDFCGLPRRRAATPRALA